MFNLKTTRYFGVLLFEPLWTVSSTYFDGCFRRAIPTNTNEFKYQLRSLRLRTLNLWNEFKEKALVKWKNLFMIAIFIIFTRIAAAYFEFKLAAFVLEMKCCKFKCVPNRPYWIYSNNWSISKTRKWKHQVLAHNSLLLNSCFVDSRNKT